MMWKVNPMEHPSQYAYENMQPPDIRPPVLNPIRIYRHTETKEAFKCSTCGAENEPGEAATVNGYIVCRKHVAYHQTENFGEYLESLISNG